MASAAIVTLCMFRAPFFSLSYSLSHPKDLINRFQKKTRKGVKIQERSDCPSYHVEISIHSAIAGNPENLSRDNLFGGSCLCSPIPCVFGTSHLPLVPQDNFSPYFLMMYLKYVSNSYFASSGSFCFVSSSGIFSKERGLTRRTVTVSCSMFSSASSYPSLFHASAMHLWYFFSDQ